MGFRATQGRPLSSKVLYFLSIYHMHLSLCHHLSLHATILPREFPYLTHSGTMRMAGIWKILISLCRTWPMSNKETHFKKSPFNRVNNIIYLNTQKISMFFHNIVSFFSLISLYLQKLYVYVSCIYTFADFSKFLPNRSEFLSRADIIVLMSKHELSTSHQ